jgi:hypothetical protein
VSAYAKVRREAKRLYGERFISLGEDHHAVPILSSGRGGDIVGYQVGHVDARDGVRNCATFVPTAGIGKRWVVQSEAPLSLSPSVVCILCGDHGWVKEGKWEKA